jgi:hypothetical protein
VRIRRGKWPAERIGKEAEEMVVYRRVKEEKQRLE